MSAAAASTTTDEQATPLAPPTWSDWSTDGRTDEERSDYLNEHIYQPYRQILDEFFDSADTCVERFDAFRRRHERWRHIVIVGTGVVAIVNAVAALITARPTDQSFPPVIAISVAGLAAVAAAVLAILANLENFGNFVDRAQAYREAREMFLDAYREFDRQWQVYVVAFWNRPEALANATELYRRICIRDSELRRKIKDMTHPRGGNGGT